MICHELEAPEVLLTCWRRWVGGGGLSVPDLLHQLQQAADLPQAHPGGVAHQAGPRGEAGAAVGEQEQVVGPPGSNTGIAGRKLGDRMVNRQQ